MRSGIVYLSVLSTVLRAANALRCLQCIQPYGETCEGVSVECPDSANCVVLSEVFKTDKVYHSIKKGCGQDFKCNRTEYADLFGEDHDGIRVNVQCCTGDNCNSNMFTFPPRYTERKGKMCPTCFEFSLKECKSDKKVRCFNEEDQCFIYIGEAEYAEKVIKNQSGKGCISPEFFKQEFQFYVGIRERNTIEYKIINDE